MKLTNSANVLRLMAANVINQLWVAGETEQLKLLEAQVRLCLDKQNKGASDGDD